MEHLGFPHRWMEWILALLRSASTRVLVNGRLGERICHAKGLRQGDMLSPLLFVIVMVVLNSMITEADRRHILTPLPGPVSGFRVSLYANDLVVLLVLRASDFCAIRRLLEVFAMASGLWTNIDKCTVSETKT